MPLEMIAAFKCPGGGLETDRTRALAWHLAKALDIEFTPALRLLLNPEVTRAFLNELAGRPMSTDEFLGKLFEAVDHHYDREEAIKAWLEGAWGEALECIG